MKVKEEVGAVEGVIDSGLRQPRNMRLCCQKKEIPNTHLLSPLSYLQPSSSSSAFPLSGR